MVVGSRIDGGTPNISARVRKTIQSIKEIVGNHSEADIYVTLKESNMDPNETAQKLLYQDPFHEVRRRRDKKKENISYKASSAEPRGPTENTKVAKSQAFPDRNVRRGGFIRNAQPGFSREFRVVRDNRVNQNTSRDIKPGSLQSSSSASVEAMPNVAVKSSTGILTDQVHLAAGKSQDHKSSQAINRPSDSTLGQDVCSSGSHRKALFEDTWSKIPSTVSVAQGVKPLNSRPSSATLASSSSEVGVYSSSSDPVHVPSPDSRSSGAIGAIKREVGVVGVRRQPSENPAKPSSVTSSSLLTLLSVKDVSSPPESYEQPSSVTKTGHHGQATVSESTLPSVSTSKSFLGSQHTSKAHQLMGHQKAMQPNMEWKPKSSQKSSSTNPGVTGAATNLISPPNNVTTDSKLEEDHLEGKFPQLNINGSQHVIIPEHLRVPEADRTRLTFGSFDLEFDPSESFASRTQGHRSAEQSIDESSANVSDPLVPKEGADEVELLSAQTRSSGSFSPGSDAASGHPSPDKKDSSSPRDLENYADIGLVRNDSPSYTPAEPQQQHQPQDVSGLPNFVAYDPQTAYDMPFFNPAVEESSRGQGFPSPQEPAMSSNLSNSISASTVAMIQQQPMTQLYPQMHVSHYPNFVPYRQFLSPVYVPPMAVPGYSSNPSYPHPSNGNSYLLMPGSSSHLAAGGLKYGTSQYKPVPAGTPTGFGSYSNPPGYVMNAQGTVGGAGGLEDSTRIKYKDGNLFIPNAQAEASELWIQTLRELPSLPSTPFYSMAGQAPPPHAAYLPSHTGHASFNAAAAAAAQPGAMQFPPALYHPSPQAAAIANPHHHMVPGMGSNVGAAAAAAPGAQVGAYQQPQLGGHLNWNTNF